MHFFISPFWCGFVAGAVCLLLVIVVYGVIVGAKDRRALQRAVADVEQDEAEG